MIEILKIDSENIKQVKKFLEEVPTINDIDDDILKNGSLVIDEEMVIGILSYEKFGIYGLIRYFVFKKTTDNDTVKDLYLSVLETAKGNGVKKVFAIIVKEDVKELFELFGFNKVNNSDIFINEDPILEGKYKDALIMMTQI